MDTRENVLVACALKKEAEGLRENIESDYRSLVTGLGSDRTMKCLEKTFDRKPPPLMIFTGMAGQLHPDLELAEFIFPVSWQFESGTSFSSDATLIECLRQKGWEIQGVGVTVRRPVVREKARLKLHRKTGGLICDMESAAALMVATAFSVPCLCPKLISDTPDSGMLAFYRYFDRNIKLLAERIEVLLRDLRELGDWGG